jgi:hypothetical protein
MEDWRLLVDVFNIFDAKVSNIDYYYTSRLPGEPAAGVNDIHTHPYEPLDVRVTLNMKFQKSRPYLHRGCNTVGKTGFRDFGDGEQAKARRGTAKTVARTCAPRR